MSQYFSPSPRAYVSLSPPLTSHVVPSEASSVIVCSPLSCLSGTLVPPDVVPTFGPNVIACSPSLSALRRCRACTWMPTRTRAEIAKVEIRSCYCCAGQEEETGGGKRIPRKPDQPKTKHKGWHIISHDFGGEIGAGASGRPRPAGGSARGAGEHAGRHERGGEYGYGCDCGRRQTRPRLC